MISRALASLTVDATAGADGGVGADGVEVPGALVPGVEAVPGTEVPGDGACPAVAPLVDSGGAEGGLTKR